MHEVNDKYAQDFDRTIQKDDIRFLGLLLSVKWCDGTYGSSG